MKARDGGHSDGFPLLHYPGLKAPAGVTGGALLTPPAARRIGDRKCPGTVAQPGQASATRSSSPKGESELMELDETVREQEDQIVDGATLRLGHAHVPRATRPPDRSSPAGAWPTCWPWRLQRFGRDPLAPGYRKDQRGVCDRSGRTHRYCVGRGQGRPRPNLGFSGQPRPRSFSGSQRSFRRRRKLTQSDSMTFSRRVLRRCRLAQGGFMVVT